MELRPTPSLHLGVVSFVKGAFGSPSTKVDNLLIYIYIVLYIYIYNIYIYKWEYLKEVLVI